MAGICSLIVAKSHKQLGYYACDQLRLISIYQGQTRG